MRVQKRAFTLLELLVAMLLMVVASACLYTSLYTGFRARRSAAAATEPTTKAINALTLIKHELLGTQQPSENLAGDFIGTDAAGDGGTSTDSISFYTTHAQPQPESPVGGVGMIELALVLDEEADNTDEETYLLVRRVDTNLLATNPVTAEDQILCRQVRSLNLRYHDGTDWLDAWDTSADSDGLPVAVEIDLEIQYVTQGHHSETLSRHLVQSFPLPCGGPGPSESDSEEEGQGEMMMGGDR